MTINWPKPYTKALTRDQIRLVLRIYWTDVFARRKQGYVRCTRGLIPRLAAEFGVKQKLIEHIVEIVDTKKRRMFPDINLKQEKTHVLRRQKNRTRYCSAALGSE